MQTKLQTYYNPSDVTVDSLPSDMSAEDKHFVARLMQTYANTGVTVSAEDRAKAEELIKKYNIRVNRNPRKIISRYARILWNSANGPYTRTEPKPASRRDKHRAAVKAKKKN